MNTVELIKPTLVRCDNNIVKSTNLTLIHPKYLDNKLDEPDNLDNFTNWANVTPYSRPLSYEIMIQKRQITPLTYEELSKLTNSNYNPIHLQVHTQNKFPYLFQGTTPRK